MTKLNSESELGYLLVRQNLDIITRLANRLLGTPLIRNDIRGELGEEMVAVALEPEWQLCAGDWAAFDLKQADDPLRIQIIHPPPANHFPTALAVLGGNDG